MAEPRIIRVALAGNPNSGKTSVFNRLTGARQHVANYPGVTVEKKEGRRRHGDCLIEFVDLPGTYSLTAYSEEEMVARNYCIHERPDVVVDVLDASNLERNLYLAVQFMELGVPLVLALNMSDLAQRRGMAIDVPRLSQLLGVPLVPTVATRGTGIAELVEQVVAIARRDDRPPAAVVRYGREVEDELLRIESLLPPEIPPLRNTPRRWVATKLLEGDAVVTDQVERAAADPESLRAEIARSQKHLHTVFGDSPEILVADRRYGFISGACRDAVRTSIEARHDVSDRIDAVVTHQLVGPLIFLLAMLAVFSFVFLLGNPLRDHVEVAIDRLGRAVAALWPPGSDSPLMSLLVDGVIGGVGAVVAFLPNVMLLFLALAFLEDSGYLARAAFIMDRVMHRLGLHGKSFVPMLIGFGCSVPAILATRTLDTRRDRLTTMLILPLVSCSARLPIYLMILPAFFPPRWQAPILWLVYLIGILLAVLLARLLRRSLLKGEVSDFVLELPPYRMPTLRGVLIHMWERSWSYLRKAGTIILAVAVVMWALTSYPKLPPDRLAALDTPEQVKSAEVAHSFAGRIGRAIAPALRPLGFDWRIATALIPAFAAKETFVSQMGIVFNLGDVPPDPSRALSPLTEQIRHHYSPLVGFCVILFCLVSSPCMATVIVTWRESGRLRWALLQLGGLTALAYALTLLVYQLGAALNIGTRILATP